MSDDDQYVIAGTWRPQRIIKAEVDTHMPFVVMLTFKDGNRARINLKEDRADNLGDVHRDTDAYRELHVDDELGAIAWPNGFDYDSDSLRMLAMEQHPNDPAAAPEPLQ